MPNSSGSSCGGAPPPPPPRRRRSGRAAEAPRRRTDSPAPRASKRCPRRCLPVHRIAPHEEILVQPAGASRPAPPPLRAASGTTRVGETSSAHGGGARAAPARARAARTAGWWRFAGLHARRERGSRGGIGGAAPAAAFALLPPDESADVRVADVDVPPVGSSAGDLDEVAVDAQPLEHLVGRAHLLDVGAAQRHHEVALQSVLLRGGLILLEDQVAAVDLPVPIPVRRQREGGALSRAPFSEALLCRRSRWRPRASRKYARSTPSRRNSSQGAQRARLNFARVTRDALTSLLTHNDIRKFARAMGCCASARSIPVPRTTQKTHCPRAWRLRHQHQHQPPARLRALQQRTLQRALRCWQQPPAMKRLDTVEALEAQIAAEQTRGFNAKSQSGGARALRDAKPPPSMAPGARRSWAEQDLAGQAAAAQFRGHFQRLLAERKRPTRAQTAATPLTAKRSATSSPSLAAIVPGAATRQSRRATRRDFELLSSLPARRHARPGEASTG